MKFLVRRHEHSSPFKIPVICERLPGAPPAPTPRTSGAPRDCLVFFYWQCCSTFRRDVVFRTTVHLVFFQTIERDSATKP
ncbi:hypothetical protein ebA7221 [Aromatoleum aromaticum EbN1]|uniref:Uncharacterized protein n=1 Tax=Aromatoleum aromaticum (strain DSM 19018 / LMG 30748 / EbN1) TaxID=76114 RepID=Q5NXJ5_AROAE|nr:hypothetical protein ebA7221 [Aromatoleum aromaticum EbN1]